MCISKTAVIAGDFHIPYETENLSLFKKFLKDLKPDELIINGDFIDAHHLSVHPKVPGLLYDFPAEAEIAAEILNQLCRLAKKTVFLQGNHDARIEKYIALNAPQFFSLAPDTQAILRLAALGIEYIPEHVYQAYKPFDSDVIIRHTPPAGGKNCASAALREAHRNIIFGHTHRIQEYVTRDAEGRTLFSVSGGCMCNTEAKTMQYVKGHKEWGVGFVILRVVRGKPSYEVVRIEDNHFIAGGNLYEDTKKFRTTGK